MLHFTEVLKHLDHCQYISGQELADRHSVTRATIHNCIQKIDEMGIGVERVRGLGYRLLYPVDFLHEDQILSQLPTNIRRKCSQIHCLHDIDSTNQFASSLDAPTNPQFSLVLAEQQSAGRGRRGRKWVSPYAANIYLSIVWSLRRSLHESGILSPLLALDALKCLSSLGVPDLGVKWPNDIYCDKRKLSGLLIECIGEMADKCKLVIGLGVNVSMSRVKHEDIDQQWTDISTHVSNWTHSRNELSAHLITSLVESLLSFEQGGIANIVDEWKEWDIMLNKHVNIISNENEKSGIARGIDLNGCLQLETVNGVEKITAGDVSLRMQ